jgi:hypothetical protein
MENKKNGLLKIINNLFPLLLILFGTFPAIAPIFQPGYFSMHDDLQAMRQLQMDKCFRDLQLPCRWVPDMGYGFGYPLFNYYPPLPYYIGEVVHLLGFSFLDTIKVVFILAFLVSALTMYILAKEFWGDLGGVVSALFYVWVPYHAVDVYVRGAMNEAWAIAFFPLVLWSIYKIIDANKWIFVLTASFSISMLALSHNPALMVFAPGALLWALFWLWQKKSLASFLKLVSSGLWAVGLASFFTLPVILELKYVHVETLFIGYFNYLAHFLNLNQLFVSRYWGYGESVLGPADTMSFSLGHLHWIGTIVALFVAWGMRKKMPEISLTILFFFAWTYFYTFLTHQRAALIWRLIPQLANLQFPWRILAISAIGTSFLAGSIFLLLEKIPRVLRLSIAGAIIIFLVIFNIQFFTWRDFLPWLTDSQKFSGQLWQLQQTAGIFDYLPKQLPLPPKDPPSSDGEIIAGLGTFQTLKKNSKSQEYAVDVTSDLATFKMNTFYFPGWQVFVDGKRVIVDQYRDKVNGTMIIDLPKGEHQVKAIFTKTKIRAISDIISAVSWLWFLIFLGILISKKKYFEASH